MHALENVRDSAAERDQAGESGTRQIERVASNGVITLYYSTG